MDPPVARRIFKALDRFVTDPSKGDVKKLAGKEPEWRLRVGEWRVRFWYDNPNHVIVVLRVLPRGEAYRR